MAWASAKEGPKEAGADWEALHAGAQPTKTVLGPTFVAVHDFKLGKVFRTHGTPLAVVDHIAAHGFYATESIRYKREQHPLREDMVGQVPLSRIVGCCNPSGQVRFCARY